MSSTNDNDAAASDPLARVTSAHLLPLVRQALEQPSAEAVVDWEATRINKGSSGSGLYQLKGTAQAGECTAPWSLFLKILRVNDRLVVSESEWKCEALLYASGLVDEIPGGLRAVRCYGQEQIADNEIWLWLEDASETEDIPWPLERHALAAYHLGQFNGSQLAVQALPTEEFLSREFDRKYFIRDGHTIAPLLEALDQADMRRILTDDVLEAIHWLWGARETVISHMYDRLPQCFGHLDTARVNLFSGRRADGSTETIAIDWARSGIGPVGEELRSMLAINLIMRVVDIEQGAEYERAIFEAYIEGLADSGWRADPHLAHYGLAATSAVFALLRNAPNNLPKMLKRHDLMEKRYGSVDNALNSVHARMRLAMGWAHEVRRLGPVLF